MAQGQQEDGGAFWLATDKDSGEVRLTKNGDKFWKGHVIVNGVKMAATLFFKKAEQKKNPKQPDFQLSFSKSQGGQQMNDVRSRMANVPAPSGASDHEEIRVEDIPF